MAAALDKAIHDAVLRHHVDLTRVEAAVRAKVMRRLLALRKELSDLVLTNSPKTKKEVDALLARSRAIVAKHYARIEADMRPVLKTVAQTTANNITNAIERAKVKVH